MKLSTAISVLQKEAQFLGTSIDFVLTDVSRYGRLVYSQRVVEAAKIFVAEKQQEELSPFATVNS